MLLALAVWGLQWGASEAQVQKLFPLALDKAAYQTVDRKQCMPVALHPDIKRRVLVAVPKTAVTLGQVSLSFYKDQLFEIQIQGPNEPQLQTARRTYDGLAASVRLGYRIDRVQAENFQVAPLLLFSRPEVLGALSLSYQVPQGRRDYFWQLDYRSRQFDPYLNQAMSDRLHPATSYAGLKAEAALFP